jgi:ArsR family transcriptional regulator
MNSMQRNEASTSREKRAELDSILSMIENPVRREIIKRLSQEPGYPLQLSKELGIGQQLIAKHLDALEGAGIVTSTMEKSPSGPSRKEYVLKKSVSLSLSFAPNLFSTQLVDLALSDLEEHGASKQTAALVNKLDRIIRSSSDDQSRINSMGKLISELDKHLAEIEEERAAFLYIRNLVMREAATLVQKSQSHKETRRVIYYMLDSHNRNVAEISESANLREEIVRKLLDDLESELGL